MSSDARPTGPSRSARGPTLLDLIALSVGYSLAAALLRSFWTGIPAFRAFEAILLVGDYCWLGLAMSGPFILLFTRCDSVKTMDGDPEIRPKTSSYTRAECAWLFIGAYWIILTAVVAPTRMARSVAMTVALLPLAFLAVFWMLRVRSQTLSGASGSWTDRAALVVLYTWPLVWVSMIILTSIWP